jgi:hypothetical protein
LADRNPSTISSTMSNGSLISFFTRTPRIELG